eukprot:TRINITY_DN571_c0_g1_i2.p1 TRINITY_DN571_c0_g1~~TRINITY_DN571_c0_g1_i2.p1  ORF type:complete len:153 (+),score=12.63 TRINITY_DN571_c0_g1_i2:46-504(+)
MSSVVPKAPEFSLPNGKGQIVSLSDFVGKKNLVIFFFPKSFTSFCTRENQAFSKDYKKFVELNAEVLGVSRDDVETQDKFVCTYNFPFQVLSDKDGKVGEAFEIGKDIFGLVDGRTSYVIDINGNIVSRHHAMIRVSSHVDEALKTLQTLNK